MNHPRVPTRLLVISPHLDDAVLGCACALLSFPGAVVLTLFAGVPGPTQSLTDWDERCGYRSSTQAMTRRRQEDAAALRALQARPWHLDFLDAQYRKTEPAQETLAQAIRDAVSETDPHMVMIPLGLFHSDHLRVHDAAWAAWSGGDGRWWFCYEDLPYVRKCGILQERLARLHAARKVLTPHTLDIGIDAQDSRLAKRDALACYGSQLPSMGMQPDSVWTLPSERYWRMPGDRA